MNGRDEPATARPSPVAATAAIDPNAGWQNTASVQSAVLLAVGYFSAISISLAATRINDSIAYCWLPTALLVPRLAVLPVPRWPAPVIACGLAIMAAVSLFGAGALMAAPSAVVLLAEAALGALLLRRFLPDGGYFDTVPRLALYALLVGGVTSFVSAFGGGAVIAIGFGMPYWAAWLAWFMVHALSMLIFSPIVVLVTEDVDNRWLSVFDPRSGGAINLTMLLALILVIGLTFGQSRFPLLFLPLLPLTLLTLGAGRFGAALGLCIVAVGGGVLTMTGNGPVALTSGDAATRALCLQIYLAATVMTLLPLAVELTRRKALGLALEKSEGELRQSIVRHRQLIDGVKDCAIYWLDPTGHVDSWNLGAETMKGYDAAEIVGASYSIFFTPSDCAAGEPTRILATALRDGKFIGEGWRVRKDGTTFWAEVSVEAVNNDAGVLIGFAKVSRDVTERRELERGRKASHLELQQKSHAVIEANRLLLMAEEMSRTGHWRLDVGSNTLFWSDAVCAIHGRPPGYTPFLEDGIEAYHPDDRATVQLHVDHAIAMGTPFEFEARIIREDGVTRQVLARGRTEVGPDGSVDAMFGVIQDITEASRQQQALAASEEKYALTLRGMSVGVWDWDIVNNHLYWSEKLLQIVGLDKELSRDSVEFADRLHPDDKRATHKRIKEHLEKRTVYDIEYRLRHARGHYVWVHVMGQAIWNEAGEPRRMSGSAADITDFKRQQQALIESEKTFRRAIENAVVGNALVAPDGKWLTVNRALCALVGYEEADLLRDGSTLIQDTADPWSLKDTVKALLSGASGVVEGERWLRHREGHLLWVNVSASLVTRDSGAADYLVIQFQDLTERKRMEIVKDEFVSTVNHELRTPLTSIFGSLRLLGATTAGKLDAKSARLLEVAQLSCTHLSGLVNDILDIEKIAAGKMNYQMATVAAGPLIQDIINRHGAIADLHGIRFHTRLDVDGRAITVDPNRFNQALVNLLSNAAKYSSPGDQVDIVATRDGAAAIRISVTDHGPGIPQAFRSRIFGRFAQADNSTTRKVGGTGLGLNITKTLIEAFGGTVSFDSVEGQGATFHFVLPACELMATQLELEANG